MIKRVFLILIVLVCLKNPIRSQIYPLPLTYSEPLLINPAFAGAADCNRINLNYKKQLASDFSSVSYLHKFEKYSGSAALIISDLLEGKSINTLRIGGIFSKKIELNYKNRLHFALHADYFQQNINSQRLIFRHQVNPLSEQYGQALNNYSFPPVHRVDFSAGAVYLSPGIRAGIALHQISALYQPDERLNLKTNILIHFGKSFRAGSSKKEDKIIIIPEFFTQYSGDKLRLAYGTSVYTTNFDAQLMLNYVPNDQLYGGAIGFKIKHGQFYYGYAYELMTSKYLGLPLNNHSVSITFKYQCKSKRNKKNTIFCTSF